MSNRFGSRVLNLLMFAAMAAGFVALFAFAATPAAAQGHDGPTIQVTGEGEVTVKPDMAYISIGVREEREDADAAVEAMSAALAMVLDRLEAEGIPPADIRTGTLRLDPMMSNGSSMSAPEVTGFVAYSSLEVAVRDLDRIGAVLDTVVQDGANSLDGLRFDLQDRSDALAEARQAAVADARDKAQLFASAAAVTLGDLVTLTEGGSSAPPMPMMEARMMSDVPVAQGEMTISAQVSMVYAVE
ncbi:SIMPL domain-containing protein [Pelagovum pacificum]|uniref:DUF541 domain-containing protein n=1 Tax=Pelagovum pacificum TaxID=2588711 RepID=A0A5C5GDR8_9RHOB|nr:SIMPL domain-containing protein [Pelagovum pacificum]QQA44008.1 SIMPL domain-containing protein [Pelagovum pacificum]TNY32863.1 DUF541 domain-containing protein [Pelagovum pacificum]